jgi:hypothetical protein
MAERSRRRRRTRKRSADMARIRPAGSGGSRRADQVDLRASAHLSARNLTFAVDRLGRCLFPDLPVAGNPRRCRRTLTCVGRAAVFWRAAVTIVRVVLADPRSGRVPEGSAVNGQQLIVLADDAGHRAVPLWLGLSMPSCCGGCWSGLPGTPWWPVSWRRRRPGCCMRPGGGDRRGHRAGRRRCAGAARVTAAGRGSGWPRPAGTGIPG